MLKSATGDRLWTITIMSLAVAVVGAAAIPFLPPLAQASWPYVLASGLLHVGYNVFLVKTYGSGDFSETYPIARGSSPMLIAMGAADRASRASPSRRDMQLKLSAGPGIGAPSIDPIRLVRVASE